jgi:hypothetical protein
MLLRDTYPNLQAATLQQTLVIYSRTVYGKTRSLSKNVKSAALASRCLLATPGSLLLVKVAHLPYGRGVEDKTLYLYRSRHGWSRPSP